MTVGAKIPTPPPGGKRVAGGEAGGDPSPKKPRISDKCIVDARQITQALLVEVKLVGKDAVHLQIRAGSIITLQNKTNVKIALLANTLLCQFGKGAFKLIKGDENPTEKQYPFALRDDKELVVLGQTVQTLGKVIEDQRQTKPDCVICYHKMVRNEENPKLFTLDISHKVAFEPLPRTTQPTGRTWSDPALADGLDGSKVCNC